MERMAVVIGEARSVEQARVMARAEGRAGAVRRGSEVDLKSKTAQV